jgi:beta-glucosidase
MLPLLDSTCLTTEDGSQNGLDVHYFNGRDLSAAPVQTDVTPQTQMAWFGDPPHADIDPKDFSATLTGTFTPPETGTYTFGLTSFGMSRLFIDGEQLIDNSEAPTPRDEQTAEIEMRAGQPYHVRIEYHWEGESQWRTVRLGCTLPTSSDPIGDAVALAEKSDVAIVFAGLTDEWESEGVDRADMELCGDQVELIERVASVNPNTVVVLNTGSPITMNWLDRVAAVVQAWYPGQEVGSAVADVLFGDVNPSGKLPQTFPKRLKDNPAYVNYPGENGLVYYGEGIFVGYRYYDKKDIEPLFPFGHGLSYTTFAYQNLSLDAAEYVPGDEIRVSVDVTNTGDRAGKEVVQLYVRDVESRLVRPEKELKAFAKVALEPGQTKTVTLTLDRDALSFYNPARKRWMTEAGEFQVLVGSSAHDIRLTGSFMLQEDPADALDKTARLHVGLNVGELLDDEAGKAVLQKHIPRILAAPQISMALEMPLEQLAGFVPDILTPEKLRQINEDLAAA